ncbi:MAG TPA: hypothetical protein DEP84_11370 [Chloroflexi bacterium]|nr:hypothetical protein [Chloroflexota bacterium]
MKSAYLDLEARPVGIDLSTHFKLFSRIYDIPGRWEALIDEICDALFRRIRQVFADDLVTDPDVLKSTAYIKNKLDWLLAFIDEFQGSANYAYPAKWWLTQLIIDYVDNNVDSQINPLLREIESWKVPGNDSKRNFGERAQRIKACYSDPIATIPDLDR